VLYLLAKLVNHTRMNIFDEKYINDVLREMRALSTAALNLQTEVMYAEAVWLGCCIPAINSRRQLSNHRLTDCV
jgi:hypothetical protein